MNKYLIDIPLFDPDETIKNIVQAIDLQNRNITSLRGLRTLMLGMPLYAKQIYYKKLLETYDHMKEFYETQVDTDDEDESKYSYDKKMQEAQERIDEKLNEYKKDKDKKEVLMHIKVIADHIKSVHFKPPDSITTLAQLYKYAENDWKMLVEFEQVVDILNQMDGHMRDEKQDAASKDVKVGTRRRSAGKLIDGVVYVECYDCNRDIVWAEYNKHIKTKIHKDNERDRDYIDKLLGIPDEKQPSGQPPGYDRDMGRDALEPVADKPEDGGRSDIELKIQRDTEKLLVKMKGSDDKVLQLLKSKMPKMPDNMNDLEDFYQWTDELTIKALNAVYKHIIDLNNEDLSGSGRKKRTNTKRKKTIRGKGLSVAELRARLKSIMN